MPTISFPYKYLLFGLLGLFVTLSACKEEDDNSSEQAEIDAQIIADYIAENNLDAESTDSGLHYVINNPGVGSRPNGSSTVQVIYKGYLTDGTVFDQSSNTGSTFSLNSVIDGWQEGIPKFAEGGSGILLIPSGLGYGNQANGNIPANSVLIFDIQLVAVF